MISPCVDVLRHLSKMMHNILGADQGVKHEPPNLKNDICDLMHSLNDHGVYTMKVGRKLDEDDPPVTDIITIGLQQLTDNSQNPIDEYNEAFQQIQARRKLCAIVGENTPDLGNKLHPHDSPIIASVCAPQGAIPSPPTIIPDPSNEGFESGDEDEEDDVGEAEECMDDAEESAPTLRRETAEDVSLDMDADDYPREEGVDSDSDSTFVPEGLDGDDEIDMNIAQ